MRNAAATLEDESYLGELWCRLKQGDGAAFDELAKRRYRLLFNYATKFSKDTDLIKDCIQDLFLELWYRRNNLTDTTYVTVYLIRALRNNLLRKIRIDNRIDISADISESYDVFTDNLTVESILISSESMTEKERGIRSAINRLPRRQQEVIFLKFYEGLSHDDIAKVMKVERQTVSNFLYRAIGQLKNDLPVFSGIITQMICIFFV